jgi:1-pyrroline-5-carboxylate dehydrogenase
MINGKFSVPKPANEPVKTYAPGSPERSEIKAELEELGQKQIEIPCIIGGKEVRTGNIGTCVMPHNHGHVIGTYHKAGEKEVRDAAAAALQAAEVWSSFAWQERAAVVLKAADLLSGARRQRVNGACMLAQSKNVFQAEIDAACELIDFFRFNTYYAMQVLEEQPMHSSPGVWNRVDYRPLEGFVFAVSPFNFASIAGNLSSAPAIMGNTVLWKPASNAVYTAYHLMELFREAGFPDGVINFIPGDGSVVGPRVLTSPDLAGVHFTGSTGTFQSIWETIGSNIRNYRTYPRIVGETGGKDFIVAHSSAGPKELGTALIRGAFEYQGQKCSAASRAYIPKQMWKDLSDFISRELDSVKMGDVTDFSNFMNAVIDEASFDKIAGYIDFARKSADAEIFYGGDCDKSTGYFIQPTVIVAKDPRCKTMREEIFGPVLTVYLYEDDEYEKTLALCNETSPYGLTGAIFARDREAVTKAERILVNAAGNFYINDKPTGAVVGQQPFGGSRASGTNDKAGSILNMVRWTSPRAVKENFVPPSDYRYPFMDEA